VLVYLDEPEVSLDTYVVSRLPYVLARLAGDRIAFVVSTHREDLIAAAEHVERLRRRCGEALAPVAVYEFRFDPSKRGFAPIRVEFDEAKSVFRVERYLRLEREIFEEFSKV